MSRCAKQSKKGNYRAIPNRTRGKKIETGSGGKKGGGGRKKKISAGKIVLSLSKTE